MSPDQHLTAAVARLESLAAKLDALQQKPPREYLNTEEAAEFLTLSKIQLEEWRSRNTGGPAWSKVGRRVVYALSDLRSFISERRQEPKA